MSLPVTLLFFLNLWLFLWTDRGYLAQAAAQQFQMSMLGYNVWLSIGKIRLILYIVTCIIIIIIILIIF